MRARLFIIPIMLVALFLTACSEASPGDGPDLDSETVSDTIGQRVQNLVQEAGLDETQILGLYVADWINIGISFLIVVAGYLVGTWLIRRVLPSLARRTPTTFGDEFLEKSGDELRWLAVLLALQLATARLTFLSDDLKRLLKDAYFVVGVILVFLIVWRLINLAGEWYRRQAAAEDREAALGPVIILLVRVARIIVIALAAAILLAHFGVNITAFLAAAGVVGLAFSLAAQDSISDGIAGFLILVDQPFRVGDRIEIENEGTWGDVVEIGLRTTRIRTRDNRMVIVPNSIIGKNQVINYTYPDPRYRVETHIGVAYGSDIEAARSIILDAAREVEGILPDRPVDVLYIEMGESAIVFRLRWWIESYEDTRRMFDRIHTTVHKALELAGIEIPYTTYDVNLNLNGKEVETIAGQA
jgi:small-conductance mechanosensitive channel